MSVVVSSPPARAPCPDAGFTLLEVVIALAILGTAVVAAMQGVSQGLRLLKSAGDQQQAIIVADQKARELLVPTEGTENGTDGRFTWERTSRVIETPELTPVNAPPKWRVFQISVVVTWDEQRRLEVSTLRTMPATSDPTRSIQPFGTPQTGGPSTGPGMSPQSGSPSTGPGMSPRSGGPSTGLGTSRPPGGGTR